MTLSETLHGTVAKHYDELNKLNEAVCNPISTIFAWTKALFARARFDKNASLTNFAITLERVTIETVIRGKMTKDLSKLV